MIRFYPRDIGLWRNRFDFIYSQPSIQLLNEENLRDFCSKNNVRIDDAKYPFYVENFPDNFRINGKNRYAVMQWTCIGWVVYE